MAELVVQSRVEDLFHRRARKAGVIDERDQSLTDEDQAILLAAKSDRKVIKVRTWFILLAYLESSWEG